jgi:opacity protein-like surface antigen
MTIAVVPLIFHSHLTLCFCQKVALEFAQTINIIRKEDCMSHLKRIGFILAALLSTNASANINANNGFYIGGDLGIARYDRLEGAAVGRLFDIFYTSGTSLILRPYVGYRFTDYLALEAGYNDIENQKNHDDGYWGADHYRLYSFDLAGTLIAPFANGLSLFAKGGLAYTHQNVYNKRYTDGQVIIDSTSNRMQPLLGVGISYNFTKNFATDLSYTNYISSGNIGKIILVGVGVSYTFGGNSAT